MATRTWFYNDQSGEIIHIGNTLLATVQDQLPFWHGFWTKPDAEAYKKAHPANIPIIGQAWDATAAAAKGVSITGFLAALANGNTWLRVAEVILGVALIIVGLVKFSPSVAKNVKTAGKVAAIL